MMPDWPETLRRICVGIPCGDRGPMTFLSWDERSLRVLAWPRFVTRFADVNRDMPRGPTARYGHGEYRMNFPCSIRVALVALVPAAAILSGLGPALAQSPPATPPAASAPATPAPAAS